MLIVIPADKWRWGTSWWRDEQKLKVFWCEGRSQPNLSGFTSTWEDSRMCCGGQARRDLGWKGAFALQTWTLEQHLAWPWSGDGRLCAWERCSADHQGHCWTPVNLKTERHNCPSWQQPKSPTFWTKSSWNGVKKRFVVSLGRVLSSQAPWGAQRVGQRANGILQGGADVQCLLAFFWLSWCPWGTPGAWNRHRIVCIWKKGSVEPPRIRKCWVMKPSFLGC